MALSHGNTIRKSLEQDAKWVPFDGREEMLKVLGHITADKLHDREP